MNEEEFRFWLRRCKAQYAEDKMRANNLTESEAREIAEDDFLTFLPEGRDTRDSFLLTMKHEDESVVGYLWFGIRGPDNNRKAFIFDIIVEERFRGQGFGRRAMLCAEKEAERLGLSEIGLHVFGFNKPAIRLYESLGYQTTDLVMAKKIGQA